MAGIPSTRSLFITCLCLLNILSTTLAFGCPESLHTLCKCEEKSEIIECVGASGKAVLDTLKDASIAHLRLINGSFPSLDFEIPIKGLSILEITNCGMNKVDSKALSSISNSLEELNLKDNLIKTFPSLQNFPVLKKVNLNNNQITDIPPASFINSPNIVHLRLEDNKICSITPNALLECKSSLELLDLSGNCLSSLPSPVLSNAAALQYLDLAANKIYSIPSLSLLNLPKLVELRLSDNSIVKIDPVAFVNMPELKTLLLPGNRLKEMNQNQLKDLKKLDVLDLRDNQLESIPQLSDQRGLKQLKLDGNRLTTVNRDSFTSPLKLQVLTMLNNSLSQIDSSAFSSLHNLLALNLGSNNIRSIDDSMFTGLKSLQNLVLRDNSLSRITQSTFQKVPSLSLIDLSSNRITSIEKGSFSAQEELYWLDLTGNRLSSFEKGTFDRRIPNLLLSNNRLECGEEMEPFLQYLSANNMRTSLDKQHDAVCIGPSDVAGVRLQDALLTRVNGKAKETMKVMGLERTAEGGGSVAPLIPGISSINQLGNTLNGQDTLASIPFLNNLVRSLPTIRAVPVKGSPESGNMSSAVEEFAGPLVRWASGGTPQDADLIQLLDSIPRLTETLPPDVLDSFDVSKLPPEVVSHILRGGQIPNIKKVKMEALVHNHLQKMANMASSVLKGEKPEGVEKILLPIDKLPADIVMTSMQGKSLPGLSEEQTGAIREYYMRELPKGLNQVEGTLPEHLKTLSQMVQLLPVGYNLTLIPVEFLQNITGGIIPDISRLPLDLQKHFTPHQDDPLKDIDQSKHNSTVPNIERETYEISKVTHEMINEEEKSEKASRLHLITIVALSVVGGISVFVFILWLIKKDKKGRKELKGEHSSRPSSTDPRPIGYSTPVLSPRTVERGRPMGVSPSHDNSSQLIRRSPIT